MQWLTDAVLHGKYRVGRRLGEGGMGAVYLAEHVGIGRQVALKVVHPALLADPTAADRFVREARAAGAIQHRHVVNVTDFGVDTVAGHDVAYLVMERLVGQTLEEVLAERRTLPLRLVTDLVAQVADALDAAHRLGVVHRDLKPANIWLTPDTRGGFHVTLLDFGIAKLRDDSLLARSSAPAGTPRAASGTTGPQETPAGDAAATAPATAAPAAPLATQLGESVGTPAYMSPEQCVGDTVDARSDVYSLGVVVYQLLAGTLPFRGDTLALRQQHFVAEVPPFPPTADVTPAVDAVIRRALAKDPDARFQSAPSFAAALRAHAMGFGESMRRALVVFAERMPELAVLGACFALPGLLVTAVGAIAAWGPLPWSLLPGLPLLVMAQLVATPLAMASVAAIAGDIRERPFVPITWRRTARAVTGREATTVSLYLAWARTALQRYLRTTRAVKGGGVRVMLAYIDQYRHDGETSPPERLARMGALLPTKAFATMAVAQLSALVLAPLMAMLTVLGVFRLVDAPGRIELFVVLLVCGGAVTAALFLQVFIALVDVMLYDLAYDMTRD